MSGSGKRALRHGLVVGLLVFGWVLFAPACRMAGAAAGAKECAEVADALRQITGLIDRRNYLEQAIVRCPDDYRLQYAFGHALERLRRFDEALLAYQRAARINPDFAGGYLGMGEVYLALGKNDEALAMLNQGLSLDPENPWGRRSQARAARLVAQKTDQAGGREPDPELTTLDPPASLAAAPAPTGREGAAGAGAPNVSPAAIVFTIHFPSRTNELTAEAAAELRRGVCEPFAAGRLAAGHFEVAGHTDDNGDFDHNMLLSRVRAEKVRDYLVRQCGFAPERITVAGHGSARPLAANDSREHRRMNRRVEIWRIQ